MWEFTKDNMPNTDLPPIENVNPNLVRSPKPFAQKMVESKPKRHEVEYMKHMYGYEDFRYLAHQAFLEHPWRRYRFLLRHFSEARRRAGLEIGAHVIIAIVSLIFFFG